MAQRPEAEQTSAIAVNFWGNNQEKYDESPIKGIRMHPNLLGTFTYKRKQWLGDTRFSSEKSVWVQDGVKANKWVFFFRHLKGEGFHPDKIWQT